MSRWNEQFERHPLYATLKEIDILLSKKVSVDSEQRSEKRCISKLVNAFKEILENLDPEFISHHILYEILSVADGVRSEIISYNSTGNYDYLRNANDSLDSILTHLSQLSSIAKRSESMKPVRELEKQLDQSTKSIRVRTKSLESEILKVSELSKFQKEKLENLSKSIDTKRQETDSLISAWQKQYSNEQNDRNNSFAKDQKDRDEKFAVWKNSLERQAETKFEQLVQGSNEKFVAGEKEFIEKISRYIEDAEDKHKRILELYGLVAGDSVASDYLKSAENEKYRADFWNLITLLFIFGAAGWLFFSYSMNGIDFSWERILTAFPITGIFLLGAVYSSRQSNLHRENEKRARWVSLDVKAFDPFIESLPEEKRNNLKSKIGERLFGQQHKNTEQETPAMDEHLLKTIIKAIKDALETKN